jgi:phosphate starvation-inducible PhoH-like protein
VLLDQGHVLTLDSVGRSIDIIKATDETRPSKVLSDNVVVTHTGKPIRPKTVGQKRYVDAIRDHTIVFGIGPAGSGKTYLAVALAIRALRDGDVSRIVLTRPAVEAGERLGFLPGDLAAKIDPYLKPLYDALYEMLEPDTFHRYVEQGTVEIAPLAFMRGRTVNDAFIILDEAQNTTPEQMKMFLTRLGFGSKAVVTGDVTQIDLPTGARSGLIVVEEILTGIGGVDFVHLDARDVVRHKIVQDIVEAYRVYSEAPRRASPARR